mgnify:CR=1 FL=1
MFLNRHSISQEIPSYRGHHERLPFARYLGMLHDIMRLRIGLATTKSYHR